MNNCIEQRLARNFSYQKNSGYTRRYISLNKNIFVKNKHLKLNIMTIVTVIPPKGSENNPIDQEVVKRAAIQLSKIRYNKLKEEIEKLTCQEHPNEKTSITINMNKDGDSKSIIACCEAFKVTVETAIYEIKNI